MIGPFNKTHPSTPILILQFIADQLGPYCVYATRMSKDNTMYHSLGYNRKRNSNSYTASFINQGKSEFGKILFFAADPELNCFAVVNVYKRLNISLFEGLEGHCSAADIFIQEKTLGMFHHYVQETDEV